MFLEKAMNIPKANIDVQDNFQHHKGFEKLKQKVKNKKGEKTMKEKSFISKKNH